jgi:hypothetical protein
MKVDKNEILNEFFSRVNKDEGLLDPEYMRHLRRHRPSKSHDAHAQDIWQVEASPVAKTIFNVIVKQEPLSKLEKKQIKRDLKGKKKKKKEDLFFHRCIACEQESRSQTELALDCQKQQKN